MTETHNIIADLSNQQDGDDSLYEPDPQASINIGIIGHVSHGKTTLVKALTGVTTAKYAAEHIRNSTIKLGYANCIIYKCPACPSPQCYHSTGTNEIKKIQKCKHCQTRLHFVKHISLVDCPGHELLMATMLNGAAVMDAALLLVSAENPKIFPAPQTVEHLVAAEFMGLRDIIVLQNKIDLLDSREQIESHYHKICNLTKSYECTKDSVILPISAQLGYNVDAILQMIVEKIPTPCDKQNQTLRMTTVRSFDVNKPGVEIDDLKGAVAGGTIHEGALRVGDLIELRPGMIVRKGEELFYKPFQTRVISLFSEGQSLNEAKPGGLIAVGTTLDPSLSRGDRLLGQVIGLPDKMPPVVDALVVNVTRLQIKGEDDEGQQMLEFEKGQELMLHIGASSIKANVDKVRRRKNKEELTVMLQMPVCANLDEDRITISCKVEKSYRLVAFAAIVNGREIDRV